MDRFSTHPIQSPADLRGLSLAELEALAREMRQVILLSCLRNGGHLGASLGTVELAIALHLAFESPREPIVWDVGHSAYAHKLITGRWNRFATLRLEGGLSGFLARDESEHDVFGAGHSSTSLSAALGLARARVLLADPASSTSVAPSWTVAVIGDGGLTAGLAFEALNNLHETETGPFLIVVNDNQMSISRNLGALPTILAGPNAADFFRQFGCDYLGPVDGHDLNTLIETFRGIKEQGQPARPIVVHAITQKGKGYAPAEELPVAYHGISPVQEKTPGTQASVPRPTFSETLGQALVEIAAQDPRLVAITAAMKEGTGLTGFAECAPGRFFDVGIAEAHAVTFAGGLAAGGARPVVCVYSTFLQRALDAIIHDVALQKLPVIFAIDRAGVVGADGPTHHGAFDLAYLGAIPGLRISSPACLSDLKLLLERALLFDGPWAIRYPRGSAPDGLTTPLEGSLRWHHRASGAKLVVVALGPTATRAEAARQSLDPSGELITLVSTLDAKPFPPELLDYLMSIPDVSLLTVEDGAIRGGFGEALAGALPGHHGRREHAGYTDRFLPAASPAALEESQGLSVSGLVRRMKAVLG
jgi:1-deoxy-D-xylulose-5-phosphate synthase